MNEGNGQEEDVILKFQSNQGMESLHGPAAAHTNNADAPVGAARCGK